MESMPARGPTVKSFHKRFKEYVVTKLRCGRGDDVVTGAYNMPVPRSARPSAAPSSRPSEARTSHGQWGRVRVLQRHCHDMTHLCHYIALLRCCFVRGRHRRTMAWAWIRCPSCIFPQTHMHTQDMAHTLKVRDLSRISPREGSPCPRRLVSQI